MSVEGTLIFTFVGKQVMAVKNSLLLMLNNHSEVFAKKIVFCFSDAALESFNEKHGDPIKWAKNTLIEGKKRLFMETLLPEQVEIKTGKISNEHDIEKIKNEVVEIIKSNINDEIDAIIIDITPGRKSMGVAGFLAAIELYKEFKQEKNIYLHYYWFKSVSQAKNKEKEAWEIYEDEYNSKIWSIEKLIPNV